MKKRFLREEPPRYIDFYSQGVVVFSGMIQQFGWIFFVFGMVFVWVFGGQSELRNFTTPIRNASITTGTVSNVKSTNASENEVTIFAYHFNFEQNSEVYKGISYHPHGKYSIGDSAQVRFDKDHPERSHIVGQRRAIFSSWVFFVFLFPLVGLIFVANGLVKNIRRLRLLRVGKATTGIMTSKTDTKGSVTINDTKYPIYAYTFDFEYEGETYQAKAKTHLTDPLEDEKREIILFDHLKPSFSLVFDGIPHALNIDEEGYLKSASVTKMYLFILPVLSVLVNLLGYLLTN